MDVRYGTPAFSHPGGNIQTGPELLVVVNHLLLLPKSELANSENQENRDEEPKHETENIYFSGLNRRPVA